MRKKTSKTVSIAMCTYNGEKFIRDQLNSIINQTFLPDEVVICDDGSTDSTIRIAKEILKKVPFQVRIFRNTERLGYIKNFEKAVSLARGDIIFLSDQDDIFYPNKIKSLYNELIFNENAYLIFSNANLIDENGSKLNKNLWESVRFTENEQKKFIVDPMKILLKHNVVTGATIAFKKELLQYALPFYDLCPHDTWIALVTAVIHKKILLHSEPLMGYRIHSHQTIGLPKSNPISNLLRLPQANESLKKKLNNRIKCIEKLISINPEYHICNVYVQHIKNRFKIYSKKYSAYRKILIIEKEIFNLRYFKFSNGIRNILRDLISILVK